MDGLKDQSVDTLHINDGSGDADVASWVSVCPRGLCKVRQKRSGEGNFNSEGDTSMILFYSFRSKSK